MRESREVRPSFAMAVGCVGLCAAVLGRKKRARWHSPVGVTKVCEQRRCQELLEGTEVTGSFAAGTICTCTGQS